jgi:large subunit ribosomal protein L10
MDNPRPEKVAIVDEVKKNFEGSNAVVLTEYRGLDVDAMGELRGALREAGGNYKIYKNTLVRFAANDLDLEIDELLTGPTAIAFVTRSADGTPGDTVTVAKALKNFAKDNPGLVIKGGLLDNRLLAPDEINRLADLAPREELLARFAGGLAAPLQKFAGLLQAVPRNFAYGLAALIADGGSGDAPEPAAEAPEAPEAPEEVAEAEEAAPEASTDDASSTDESTESDVTESPAEASAEAEATNDAADAAEEE